MAKLTTTSPIASNLRNTVFRLNVQFQKGHHIKVGDTLFVRLLAIGLVVVSLAIIAIAAEMILEMARFVVSF